MTAEQFGRYVIEKELGKGSMGVVYLAFDTVLERHVAIKTIASSLKDQSLKNRFVREARSAGKLNHPNIVTIYDFGIDRGHLFIAMEYLEGSDLHSLINSKTTMDIKTKLALVKQICLGLHYAHQQGIIHRDIKPANIFVLQSGRIKIVDFGLAAIQTSNLTQGSYILGTPVYTSPERLKGEKADGRSDQFSTGLILYELLTFCRAFAGDSMSSIMYNILNNEPYRLQPEIVNLYPDLEIIIQKSIQKNQDCRYPSMKAMANDLESLIAKMKHDKFNRKDPLPVSSEKMQPLEIGIGTENLGNKNQTVTSKKWPIRWPYLALLTTVLAVASYIILLKPPVNDQWGFYAFDVKPFARIQKIIQLDNQTSIPLTPQSSLTPISLRFKPGKYKIIYCHPQSQREVREKVIEIINGKTSRDIDYWDKKFPQKAAAHFSYPKIWQKESLDDS